MDWQEGDLLSDWKPQIPSHLRAKLDVADLLQEVRTRIVHASACFEGRAEAEQRSYIQKSIEAVTRETIRRYDRAKRRVGRESYLPDAIVADQTSPSQRAARNELLDRLAAALAALPTDQRQAIELRHLEGLPLTAVAARLGKTAPAVAGLLRRGLQGLRKSLAGDA